MINLTNNDTVPDGEPLDLDTLLILADIDTVDIEAAILWFDEHSETAWAGALGQ